MTADNKQTAEIVPLRSRLEAGAPSAGHRPLPKYAAEIHLFADAQVDRHFSALIDQFERLIELGEVAVRAWEEHAPPEVLQEAEVAINKYRQTMRQAMHTLENLMHRSPGRLK